MSISTVLSVLSLTHTNKNRQKKSVINCAMRACVFILEHIVYLGPQFAFCEDILSDSYILKGLFED